jgi:molecular chaperone GrpE
MLPRLLHGAPDMNENDKRTGANPILEPAANNDTATGGAPAPDVDGRPVEQSEPIVSAELTPDQIDDLRTKAAKCDENWDRLVRLTADFDNFKKRAARERQDAIRFANEALLEKLVPVLDNFDMALMAANNPQANIESLRTGISMIYSQLKSVVSESGLEEIDAAGQTFDPNWHEAVSQQETTNQSEGKVLQQLRKGYKLRDRLVRPATVIVAKKPAT